MNPATRRLLWGVTLGVVTFVITRYWRDFPVRLALLSSISVAIFVYSVLQATERLRHLYRR